MTNGIKKLIFAYFSLIIFFLVALTLACLIPSSFLKKNIGKTLITFKKEGIYPSVGISWRRVALDNFTESLMFNTAYSVDSRKPFKSALTNLRLHGFIDDADQILSLEKLYLNLKQDTSMVGYERYWHGYLIFLRPFLMFFPYSIIRIVIFLFLYSGLIYILYLFGKMLKIRMALAFIFGLISVDFFYLGKSIQFSSVFLIGLFSSIYLLSRRKDNRNFYLLFFVVGGLTSFFDVLTAPMVTLGMLLIAENCLNHKIIKIIYDSLFWSIGYLSLWFSKWIIVENFYMKGAISNAFNTIIYRTVVKDTNFNQLSSIKLNFFQLRGYDRFNKFVLLYCGIIFFLFWMRYFSFKKEKIKKVVPWILIGIIPYLWYLVAANHTYYHVWYTYRNQLASVISLFLIVTEFIDYKHLDKDWRFIQNKILKLPIQAHEVDKK